MRLEEIRSSEFWILILVAGMTFFSALIPKNRTLKRQVPSHFRGASTRIHTNVILGGYVEEVYKSRKIDTLGISANKVFSFLGIIFRLMEAMLKQTSRETIGIPFFGDTLFW